MLAKFTIRNIFDEKFTQFYIGTHQLQLLLSVNFIITFDHPFSTVSHTFRLFRVLDIRDFVVCLFQIVRTMVQSLWCYLFK